MALYSIQVEKHVLGGLIQNVEIFSEIESFLSDKDFFVKPHDVIFSCIRSIYLSNQKLDKVLLAQKVSNLGISPKEDITIFDYIDAIAFAPISKEATIQACKDLVKLRSLRDIDSTCSEIKEQIGKSLNEDLDKTISKIDSMYGEKINSFQSLKEPEDLFGNLYELVEERGNNPVTNTGLLWPYKEFNDAYGGARAGNIYAFASRPAQGKTSYLNYTAIEMGKINKCPVLILDTEMSTEEIKFRNAAAFTGVPFYYIETGLWRKVPEYTEKIRTHLKNIKIGQNVRHFHVGNKTVDEVCSIIRRWYLKEVGRGNPCVVVYDYIKLTGEKLSGFWAEHQALGEKVDKFKRISEELGFPFLTAIQLNRSGENSRQEPADDGSAVSQTDRLQWFCTYLGIFRRRTEEEILLDTISSGSHKLIEIKARYQGKDAAGHNSFVRRNFPDNTSKYVRHFINFNVENFRVECRGNIHDTIARQNSQFQITDPNPRTGDTF